MATSIEDNRWSGVFPLEGAWEDDLTDRSSVLPVLELLQRLQKIKFVHRDVGTRAELEHYLTRWCEESLPYYVLYLAFHGNEWGIQISDAPHGVVTMDYLGGLLADELTDCVVHFGSCSVMQAPPVTLRRFLEQTGARAITGYGERVPWVESAAMDLIVLGVLAENKRLGTALTRLESGEAYASLRTKLGFRVLRA